MDRLVGIRDGLRSRGLRVWAVRVLLVLLVFELIYVVAANSLIRSGLLIDLINKKPEKTRITWDSAVTYLPGVASVSGFTLVSQTRRDQIYLHVAEAGARISLAKLLVKSIHIRGVDARDVDFRYRQRLDRPPKAGEDAGPREPPALAEYFPEIPGLANPPDPRPEDLYPMKKKKRPWTITITGADVEGPVRVALNAMRIEGRGSVGGGVTVRPRKTVTIHRGRLDLDPATVTVGPDVLSQELAIEADLRFEPFPARGSKLDEVVAGVSGTVAYTGRLSDRAAVEHVITPGLVTSGAGRITADLKFKKGELRAPSEVSVESDAFHVTIMGLDVTGSATIHGTTERGRGAHVTSMRISLGDFQFVDPEDQSVDITGSGLEVDARWNGLDLGEYRPASLVEIVLPRTKIHDVSTFNGLIPGERPLSFDSGTGELEARLEVRERVAGGTLDLEAKEIAFTSGDASLTGDLEVHAVLERGALETRHFDLSGTTIRLDHIVDEKLSEKKQGKLDEWFCDLLLQHGAVTFGKPMAAAGSLQVKMFDTRPLVALLKNFGVTSKALSLMPNVKNIDGEMNVDFDAGHVEIEDLDLTGKGLEVLGWIHVRDKKSNARMLIDYGMLTAGVAIDAGKARVQLAKPRKWFEEQSAPPTGPSG